VSPTTLIDVAVVVTSVALSIGVLRLLVFTHPAKPVMSQVRVLGAYSPILTWLRNGASSLHVRLRQPQARPPGAASAGEINLQIENENLKKRIAELEAQAADLQNEARRREPPALDWARLGPMAVRLAPAVVILALAAIPSWLVVQQQWFGNQQLADQLHDTWCQVGYLCQLSFPPYFGVIFLCVAAVSGLVLFASGRLPVLWSAPVLHEADSAAERIPQEQLRWSRRLFFVATIGLLAIAGWALAGQRQPGLEYALFIGVYLVAWGARTVPFQSALVWWSRHNQLVLALLLAHVALIGLLASYYGAPALVWGLAVLLIVTGINLVRYRRQVHPVYWIISAALVLYTLHINAWWFSVIGDEYSFFQYASDIATQQSLSSISQHWFSGQAVYGSHPYFSSVLQAISMKLLGDNNFGWRFSSLYLSALSIGPFYYFFRTFTQRRVALITSLLLAASSYLMTFGKIGYNNLQALFALGLALAAAAWAIRTRMALAYIGLGLALGLCLYVYPAALYVIPLPWLLLWLFDRPRTAATWRAWGLAVLTAAILIAPLLMQPGYWESKVSGTLFNNPDITRSLGTLAYHISSNLLYALFAFWYTPEQTHFVAVSYVDPLSAVFLIIGLVCLLRQAWRERFAGFMLAGFALFLFLVGASHDREFPSATRMFMLLPWWTFMAAVGLCWLLDTLRTLGARRFTRGGVLAALLVAVAGLNLYQAYTLSYEHNLPLGGLESLYLKLAQHVHDVEGNQPKTFVFVTDPDWGIDGLYMLQAAYGVPTSPAQLSEVKIATPQLPNQALNRLADRDTLVIMKPWLPADWQQSLGSQLQALGKQACPVHSTADHVVFTLWHAPELADLCP
jgi:4-amino-4-deoxy-L-arabinose transferase-like glycosyltransferase